MTPAFLQQSWEFNFVKSQMDRNASHSMTCEATPKCSCRFVQQVADANANTQRLMDRLSDSTHAAEGQDKQVYDP